MASIIQNFPNLPPELQEQILNGPARAPPPGVVPNFDNPPNRTPEAIAVIAVCLFFSTAAVLLRIYSRVFILRKVRLEDYLGLLAFATYIVLAWVILDFIRICGSFVHQYNVRFRDIVEIAKLLSFGLTIAYAGALLFAKTAILLEWVHIFTPYRTHAFFYWCSYVMIGANVLLYTGSIIASAVTCIPHESIYYPWVAGQCIDRKALGIVTAIFNVVLDLIILILPQPIIWSMKMHKQRRLGVSLIFGVGLLATACAAGRVAATFALEYAPGDSTYTISPVLLWSFPEVTCVLLVFCMPALPQAFPEHGLPYKMLRSVGSWTRVIRSRTLGSKDSGSNDPHPAGTWPILPTTVRSQPRTRNDENGGAIISMDDLAKNAADGLEMTDYGNHLSPAPPVSRDSPLGWTHSDSTRG
ncbi:hypothetical protein MMYC01_203806 [Madurella mycetomatis]|uniref:Rhodopsin domain-containing protein n=1 Tax=Madurella mycetomatis TaxID=100816 RepID=A0A175W8E0_9PEZI|nr:hypothetical protein MMYC01_203806 [Madurella mycetomatis]